MEIAQTFLCKLLEEKIFHFHFYVCTNIHMYFHYIAVLNIFVCVLQVDTKCATIIAGFQDGVVRVLSLKQMNEESLHSKRHKNSVELDILQAFKPHTKAVTSLATDHSGDMLATGVSLHCILTLHIIIIKLCLCIFSIICLHYLFLKFLQINYIFSKDIPILYIHV